LGIALQRLERLGKKALLITDYVTPALADELKAHRIAFLDTAGNAYIEDGALLIWVKGQKRQKPNTPYVAGRAFQPTGLQILFTLLCNPGAVNRPYRDLGKMAGVAHGTVGWVIPDLQQQGFVRDLNGKRGTRRLFNKSGSSRYGRMPTPARSGPVPCWAAITSTRWTAGRIGPWPNTVRSGAVNRPQPC
jgi:hypothetical protein